jgi:hypothetical protein
MNAATTARTVRTRATRPPFASGDCAVWVKIRRRVD